MKVVWYMVTASLMMIGLVIVGLWLFTVLPPLWAFIVFLGAAAIFWPLVGVLAKISNN